MTLKNHLRTIRIEAKITQEALGSEVGVSRQTIISIEKHKYNPSMELGLKLAGVLKVRVEELFFIK